MNGSLPRRLMTEYPDAGGGGAASRDWSRAQIALQIGEKDPTEFLVTRYRGTEGLCQLYRFELDLVADFQPLDFDAIVGAPTCLSINAENGTRHFHGIISRFEVAGYSGNRYRFRAELVPTVWLLTHRYSSRIFQNKKVTEIVAEVLENGGIAGDRFEFDVKQESDPREYCVQYRETDYNFICRLMEEEGIYWCFRQTEDAHILVMTNTSTYIPIEGDPELCFVPPGGMVKSADHVGRFRFGQSVRPGAVVLNDFDFKNPKLKLQVSSDNGRDQSLEISDYPGEYVKQAQGSKYARIRAEELETGRKNASGQSNCSRLESGKTFKLIEHPSTDLNAEYLVTRISHQGKQSVSEGTSHSLGAKNLLQDSARRAITDAARHEDPTIKGLAMGFLEILNRLSAGDPTARRSLSQWVFHAGQVARDLPSVAAALGGNPLEVLSISELLDGSRNGDGPDVSTSVYECVFECIPGNVAYRPPRVAPWPVMRGTQTARIVGPSGEEIYCDEYGRVKVQFNWDREGKFDDKSSCWIRVSQGMAAGQYGFMFLPRVGQEVIVDFIEGNPDCPIIVGRVFNADHMPPYKLPDEKSKSVIKTHSTKGGGGTNEIRFEDLKDKEQVFHHAEKDLHIRVKNDRVENIDNDRHLTVKSNKFELIKQSKHNEVKLDFNEKVGGNFSLKVEGNVGEKFGGNHQEEASNIFLKAGSNIVVDAGSKITLKVGGSFIAISGGEIAISAASVKINSGGSPGSAPAVSPEAPETPVEADTTEPGKDTTYSGGEELAKAEAPKEVAGHKFVQSWIEIELVDESGMPVAGEVVEITGPDGEMLRRTTTGANGVARVLVDDPGTCQISFPNLDGEAWERA